LKTIVFFVFVKVFIPGTAEDMETHHGFGRFFYYGSTSHSKNGEISVSGILTLAELPSPL